MGFWGCVGGFIAGAIGVVTGAIGAVVTSIAAVVATMSVVEILTAVYILIIIAKELGLIGNDVDEKNVEEMGDKALQAKEAKNITPENCKTYDEYLKKIEEFDLDPEKSKKIRREDKLAEGSKILSTMILLAKPEYSGVIENIINGVKNGFYSKNRLETYAGTFIKEKIGIDKMIEYFSGNLKNKPVETEKVFDALFKAERKIDSKKNDIEIEQTIKDQINNKNNK